MTGDNQSPFLIALSLNTGASDFSRIIHLASAASGMAGGIVYVARQLVTKDDLKEAKGKMKELMDKMEKIFEKRLENIENILKEKSNNHIIYMNDHQSRDWQNKEDRCILFNQSTCYFQVCRFRHACMICQGPHPAYSCNQSQGGGVWKGQNDRRRYPY